MHLSFIPYGKRECVERLLRDMEAQKHELPMFKDDKKKIIYIDGQIRVCPFGVYEYVFPKEDFNLVANTLGFNQKTPYSMGKAITLLRAFMKYKKCPKFEGGRRYLWTRDHVSILPIGMREDGEIVGQMELDKGWTHEAI
jgi:hypothetical protein